ncbi:tetratricopeptide repeat protein [Kiritimatiella glycovorans]|uniref:TPR-domain containing protein n=1 Tax=Kiritimatiella glycovorans TaxID=1307763 RepID=A0A0G3EF96_9BACT|nr:tetratricopeptide repeat protein [Kiritimatiella glycovorans]AKJ64097.1 TPR-domain containing protein [Kiritimatiella glycovorans]
MESATGSQGSRVWRGVAAALVFITLAVSAEAQSVSSMSTSQLISQAESMLAEKRYGQLPEYLNEIITRLSEIESEDARGTLDFARFRLGEAYFFTEQYDKAVTTFETYLKEMPKGQWRQSASIYTAEAHAMRQNWQGIIDALEPVMAEAAELSEKRRRLASLLIGQANFKLEQWGEAYPALRYAMDHAERDEVRRNATVMAVTCLVRLDRFDELSRLLPRVYQSDARYDVALNIALMEGGARKYDAEQYMEALLLYRLVFLKSELLDRLKADMAANKKIVEEKFRAGAGKDYDRYKERKRRAERELETQQEQLRELQDIPDYDIDIRMRIAQTYDGMKRHWPAYLLYRSIYRNHPDHQLAETARYATFSSLLGLKLEERAVEEGIAYLDDHPRGEYWEQVSLNLTRLHMKNGDFERALAMAGRALEERPRHSDRDELLYLTGFSHFKQGDYEKAIGQFAEVSEDHPGSSFAEPAGYWHGMCLLYRGKYPEARAQFASFIDTYPDSRFAQDATYRLGVCYYGEGEIEQAEETFSQFIEKYPLSDLLSEAYAMRADIEASRGEVEAAYEDYVKARENAKHAYQVSYAVFRSAKLYEMEGRYEEIIEIMNGYLERWGEEADVAEAAYWIGKARREQGNPAGALEAYLDAITRFGDDQSNYGVDLIIDDIVNRTSEFEGSEGYEQFLRELEFKLRRMGGDKRTLKLRLQTLFAQTTDSDDKREQYMQQILQPELIDEAAPSTLALMSRAAYARGKYDLVQKAYTEFRERHEASDLFLDAMLARAGVHMVDEEFDKAEPLLNDILDRYGYVADTGEAQKMLADVYREKGQYEQAVENYKKIFSVPAWGGEMKPEALYWMGVSHFENGDVRKAFGFFQRVYVLYEAYPQWAARAYLKSARCLKIMGKQSEALATYREMLNKREVYAGLPEYEEALELRDELQAELPESTAEEASEES